jgi:hypothetical protein
MPERSRQQVTVVSPRSEWSKCEPLFRMFRGENLIDTFLILDSDTQLKQRKNSWNDTLLCITLGGLQDSRKTQPKERET